MSNTLNKLLVLFTIATSFLSVSCDSKPTKVEDPEIERKAKEMADSLIAAAKAPKAETTTWTYNDTEDKMGDKTHFAKIVSNDVLNFAFPYQGGSVATLILRKEGKKMDIMFSVRPSQFVTRYDGSTIRLRFDEEKPRNYSVSEAADGSNDILFINNTTDVIKKLKAAKKLVIEAEFYQEGLRQVEFNVEGLKWE